MAFSPGQQILPPPSWWKQTCRRVWLVLRFFWAGVLFAVIVNSLSSVLFLTSDTPPDHLFVVQLWNRWIAPNLFLALLIIIGLVTLTFVSWRGSKYLVSVSPTILPLNPFRRSNILLELRKIYTDEQLASLQGINRIELQLYERFDLTNPARQVYQHLGRAEQILPDSTTIADVYNQAGRGLLLLGEPGVGKTTLLYDLALALLNRAELDERFPLPIVLNLSSWDKKRLPLQVWIVEEMMLHYLIPRQLGQNWVQSEHFLLLLDGLDEVATSARIVCIEAINTYQAEHLTSLVVCSRKEEYENLQQRLTLQRVVVVKPLTVIKVKEYLTKAGRSLAAVRKVIRTNQVLLNLLTTPLMLNVVILAYQGKAAKDLPQTGSTLEQQQQIFETYMQRMLQIHGKPSLSSTEELQRRLVRLAQQMYKRSQSLLYLEHIQPDWLETQWERYLYIWIGIRLPDILLGVLVSFLVSLLLFPNQYLLDVSLLNSGLVGGIVGALLSHGQITTSSTQSFHNNRSLSVLLGIAVSFGLIGGLGGILAGMFLNFSLFDQQLNGICLGIPCLLFALFLSKKRQPQLEGYHPTVQNVGGWRYLWHTLQTIEVIRNNLFVGVIFGLSFGLRFALTNELSDGLSNGLSNALRFGLGSLFVSLLLLQRPIMIEPAEILIWSWRSLWISLKNKRHLRRAFTVGIGVMTIVGLSVALLFGMSSDGLSVGLNSGLLFGVSYGLHFGLRYGLSAGLCLALSFWLCVGLFQGISYGTLKQQQRINPNQGIRRSVQIGLLVGMLSGVICTLTSCLGIVLSIIVSDGLIIGLRLGLYDGLGYGLSEGLSIGPIVGITGGLLSFLLSGGTAWWQHWILRFLLWYNGSMPWRAVRFLDEATRYILLRKSGGGYRFFHDLFRDYLVRSPIKY